MESFKVYGKVELPCGPVGIVPYCPLCGNLMRVEWKEPSVSPTVWKDRASYRCGHCGYMLMVLNK